MLKFYICTVTNIAQAGLGSSSSSSSSSVTNISLTRVFYTQAANFAQALATFTPRLPTTVAATVSIVLADQVQNLDH